MKRRESGIPGYEFIPYKEEEMNIKEAKTEISSTLKAYHEKDEQGNYVFPMVRQRPILLHQKFLMPDFTIRMIFGKWFVLLLKKEKLRYRLMNCRI